MKKYLYRVLGFLLLSFSIIAITTMIAVYKIRNPKLDPSVTTIIMGDSHTQIGLNVDYIDNAVNLAFSAENYIYTYNKLKFIIKKNKQVSRVILGFGYHNLTAKNDSIPQLHIIGEYFILDKESKKNFPKVSLTRVLQSIRKVQFILFSNTILNNLFEPRDYTNNLTHIETKIREHYLDEKTMKVMPGSKYDKKYLKKIVTLCKRNNVDLILINTPLHKKYIEKAPEIAKKYHYDTYNEAKPNIKAYFDLHDYVLEDKDYRDTDHLNFYGTRKFSIYVNKLLKDLK